ncbi:MAG: prephenate dehydrogenase/arogenate dehydrogenase family protein [Candidatus Thorarchaeota archaeon]
MRIAIIGAAGQMGMWLINHFVSQGHILVGSDSRSDELRELAETHDLILASSNSAAVKDADVVVVSVPVTKTSEVIQNIAPQMKPDAVLCEISSVKGKIPMTLQEASKKGIRPLCIHPMFGPGTRSLKKRIILIPIVNLAVEDGIVEILFPDSEIIVADQEEHDKIIALTISLPYFVNMILASVLADEDVNLLERLGGTTFTMQLMLTASIMSQSHTLHSTMQFENKHVLNLLQKLQLRMRESIASLSDIDFGRFEQIFLEAKNGLGEGVDLGQKYNEMYTVLESLRGENGMVKQ